jgi:tetraacyldisaccharide 4'-kinase
LNPAGNYFRTLVSGRARGLAPTLQRGLLWTASLPYDWATRLRNNLYDTGWRRSHRAPVSVVSVGNLTVGGTGKTPCVEYIARFYKKLSRRPVILSRGYASSGAANDEALVLRNNLPDVIHLQGADRVRLAKKAVRNWNADVLVLDDGFQHRRLARDLDIVLVDSTAPWGHGHLLPRGLLRERKSGMARAGLVMLTRCNQILPGARKSLRLAVASYAPQAPIIETSHQPVEWINAEGFTAKLDQVSDVPVAAFCGLGNPEAFRQTLITLGARLTSFRIYRDHHLYSPADIEELHEWARQQATDCVVVTTQKDLVKLCLPQLGARPLWALRVRLHVDFGQDVLDRKLKEALR